MYERVKLVFQQHKTEMLIVAGISFTVGALFF